MRLKLKNVQLLSSFAFKFKSRRYTEVTFPNARDYKVTHQQLWTDTKTKTGTYFLTVKARPPHGPTPSTLSKSRMP